MREKIVEILRKTLEDCIKNQRIHLEELPQVQVDRTTQRQHGDYASNIALVLAPRLKRKPRELAEMIVSHLIDPEKILIKIEVAGPGFINFTLSPQAYHSALKVILDQKDAYGQTRLGTGKKVLIEYVSANPTGPLHIGHGRNAVVGDTLARLLSACGYEVHKEFYVNDHGVQIQTLGKSALYYIQKFSNPTIEPPPPPPGSYQGAYLENLVREHLGRLQSFGQDSLAVGKEVGRDLLEFIRQELANLNIAFDHFFPESSLYETAQVSETMEELKEEGYLFYQDHAIWFRSTAFGDDKDRVLMKQDGSFTYFMPDIAYHRNKFERRFDLYLNIWGADHGGYVPRIQAAMEALGYDPDKLKVILVQMVNLKRGAERVQMSKRAGNYVTLEEVVEEVGADATRFFFMLRSANSHLDFDLDLAKKQSPDNPVYYIQYAHARIASIFRKAKEKGYGDLPEDISLEPLRLPEELDLVHHLVLYPEVLEEAAQNFEPHRITFYLLDLAKVFQTYYSRAKSDPRYRVLTEDAAQSQAKLALLQSLKIILENGLQILGVSAPEEMKSDDLDPEASV